MSHARVRTAALDGWAGLLADKSSTAIPLPPTACLRDTVPPGNHLPSATNSIPLVDFVRFSEDVVHQTRGWQASIMISPRSAPSAQP